jgi:hypothetical protein
LLEISERSLWYKLSQYQMSWLGLILKTAFRE